MPKPLESIRGWVAPICAVFLLLALVTGITAIGFEQGRESAFKEMAALAEDAYLRNQSGQGDVFTACMIEGWSQHDEFRKEWAARKVGAN